MKYSDVKIDKKFIQNAGSIKMINHEAVTIDTLIILLSVAFDDGDNYTVVEKDIARAVTRSILDSIKKNTRFVSGDKDL